MSVKLDPAVSAGLKKLQQTDNMYAATAAAKDLGALLGKMALPNVRAIESTAAQLYAVMGQIMMDEGHVLNAAGRVSGAFHQTVADNAKDPGVLSYNKMMV